MLIACRRGNLGRIVHELQFFHWFARARTRVRRIYLTHCSGPILRPSCDVFRKSRRNSREFFSYIFCCFAVPILCRLIRLFFQCGQGPPPPPPSRILFAVLRLLDTVTWQRVGNETVYSVFGHLLRPREATAMSVPFYSVLYYSSDAIRSLQTQFRARRSRARVSSA